MHSTKIKINLQNIRDLGGIKNKESKIIKKHLLIRSEKLSDVSIEDMNYLYENYNLRNIYDFRNSAEYNIQKDTRIKGIDYINHPLQEDEAFIFKKDEESLRKQKEYFDSLNDRYQNDYDGLIKHMSSFYRSLANDYKICEKYISFIKNLYQSQGCSLYHCSLGKDRAGIATVMILELLQVDRKDIYEDYLYTNDCFNIMLPLKNNIDYMNVAMKEYLDAYYDEINLIYHTYHDFLNYYGLDNQFINNFQIKHLI